MFFAGVAQASARSRSLSYVLFAVVAGCSAAPDDRGELVEPLCTVMQTNCNPGGGPGPLSYVSNVILKPGASPDTQEEVVFSTPNTASAGETATVTVTATPTYNTSFPAVSIGETNANYDHDLTLTGLAPMTQYTLTIKVSYIDQYGFAQGPYTGYSGAFQTLPTITATDVSVTFNFPTLYYDVATINLSNPSAPGVTLASNSDQAAAAHNIAFFELLTPSTTYQYDVWDNGQGFLYEGTFTTPARLTPSGIPPGHCGPNAVRSDDDYAGTTTCTYNVYGLPAGTTCSFSGAQLVITWKKTVGNANYICPSGSMPGRSALYTASCIFNDDTGPQPYENGQLQCNVSNLQVGYVYTPHDPVIGPIMQTLMTQFGTNADTAGWSVGVRRGWVEDYYLFGTANFNTQQKVRRDSMFAVGSVTKTFTGALLGRFLTDPNLAGYHIQSSTTLNSLIPTQYQVPSSDPRSTITLGELANFTSGLPDGTTTYNTTGDLWTAYDTLPLSFTPGSGYYLYSNTGITALGRAFEKPTGYIYEDLLHDELLAPLGLLSTGFVNVEPGAQTALPTTLLNNVALPYICSANQVCTPYNGTSITQWPNPPITDPIDNPGGGIFVDGFDMMAWLRFHMGHSIGTQPWLTPHLMQTIRNGAMGWGDLSSTTPQTFPPVPFTNWGAPSPAGSSPCAPAFQKDGTLVFNRMGPNNTGNGTGWQATIAYQPSLDIGAYAMSNTGSNDPQGFVENILFALAKAH